LSHLDLPVGEADRRYEFFCRDLPVCGSDACENQIVS
jgi:hypothetical protein